MSRYLDVSHVELVVVTTTPRWGSLYLGKTVSTRSREDPRPAICNLCAARTLGSERGDLCPISVVGCNSLCAGGTVRLHRKKGK